MEYSYVCRFEVLSGKDLTKKIKLFAELAVEDVKKRFDYIDDVLYMIKESFEKGTVCDCFKNDGSTSMFVIDALKYYIWHTGMPSAFEVSKKAVLNFYQEHKALIDEEALRILSEK